MDPPPPTPLPKTSPIDLDLYCLECGYNLRGLSGDPRRCPECGHLNPVIDLRMPASLVSDQLRQMETPPALCAGAAVGALTGLFVLCLVLGDLRRWNILMVPCCAMPLLGIAPFLWVLNARKFRDSCLSKPGWKRALWHYHLYTMPLALLVMSLLLLDTVSPLFSQPIQRGLEAARVPLFWLALAVIAVGGYFVHKQVKKTIQPLQRDVALAVLKAELRRLAKRRLRRPKD